MVRPSKVLIIKTGYSETLEPAAMGTSVSLGDVLISTVLLHPFKDYHVTWLTDEYCLPLLEGNPYIDKLLPYGFTAALQLKEEIFGAVINLEKVPGICALADSIKAPVKYGFGFDPWAGEAKPYPKSSKALGRLNLGRGNRPYPEMLFDVIGRKWEGEKYVLGYQPDPSLTGARTVGLNHLVGPKWPIKAWPQECFIELGHRLEESGYAASMQRGEYDLNEYMDWIGSCGLIVTGDSLGMHLAIALGKKVVALFGPTSSDRAHLYGRGVKLVAPPSMVRGDCAPCYEKRCRYKRICMEDITVERVLDEVSKLLSKEES